MIGKLLEHGFKTDETNIMGNDKDRRPDGGSA